MVFVKVRETYDLHTVKDKMTVIGIHTPKPDIIKANFPGLFMQCKAYRPVSADVKIACASVLPLDPQGVGLAEGDVAPEDVFNPILYKACSNLGMSQIEARINAMSHNPGAGIDVDGQSATVDVDTLTSATDEFPMYYGFLSNAHGWKHANPQSGLAMKGLKPLVYEILYNVADQSRAGGNSNDLTATVAGFPSAAGGVGGVQVGSIRGNAKSLPFINCTSYSTGAGNTGFTSASVQPGVYPDNHEMDVPWINCVVGAILIPPSRLHELFYRMVVEWTIEFSQIRPVSEITDWTGLGRMASLSHYQNYSYEATKEAVTGSKESLLDSDACMVSANVEVQKVM